MKVTANSKNTEEAGTQPVHNSLADIEEKLHWQEGVNLLLQTEVDVLRKALEYYSNYSETDWVVARSALQDSDAIQKLYTRKET